MFAEKTKLQIMLFQKGIGTQKFRDVIGAKQEKTARQKLGGQGDFKLREMRAVQAKLFPEMTLDEIFEGYGQ